MSEFGKKVIPGQKSLQYGAWNRLIARNSQPNVQPPEIVNAPRDYTLVNVENTSGFDGEPFAVLQTKTATWEDRDAETYAREGMRRGVEIQGETVADEWDNITITQKSIPDTTIMPGVISGPTPCWVLYPDATSLEYPFAIPIADDNSKLQASPYGKNRILWHADPDTPQSGCDPRVLQSYVNMGDDSQWVWFKLQGDLCPCSSTTALLVDECGEQVGECPIVKTVWAPMPHEDAGSPCTCSETSANMPAGEGEGSCWKEGDILPFWWYQYLEKWITLPKDPSSGSGWEVMLPQPPQIVCTAEEIAGRLVCTAQLVTPRKKLTVVDGCACLTDQQAVAIELPTPELLGTPTLTIDTGDSTGGEDDPCTCSIATLSFPVAPMSWCDGCESEERTASVSFPVPPTDGGHFESVTGLRLTRAACGYVNIESTIQSYDVICGGVCEGSSRLDVAAVRVADVEEIEFVTDITLTGLAIDLTTTTKSVVTGVSLDTSGASFTTSPTPVVSAVALDSTKFGLTTVGKQVVTGGTVSVSGGTASTTYQQATGINWNGVTFSVAIPTLQKTMVTGVTVDGCDISVTTDNITVIDPQGVPTVTMQGTPTITSAATALSFTFSPTASFTPTTETIQLPTAVSIAANALSVTSGTVNVPTAISLPSGALTVTTDTVASADSGTITGGTAEVTKDSKYVLVCE